MKKNELAAVLALKDALDKKFGQDIIVMDISDISSIADYFVIATVASAPQIAALADSAEEVLSDYDIKLMHTEGISGAKWALLDFGVIIVHLFDKESRQFYNLERVWGDAKII